MVIKSMTGYGSARGSCAGLTLRLELKSVNNRYLDCSVRLPRNLLFAEELIKSRVQQHISRGKTDVYVTVESAAGEEVAVRPNLALARSYLEAISAVADSLGIDGEISALALCRLPDVLSAEKKDVDQETASRDILLLAEQALRDFDEMREAEGRKLQEDISGRLNVIESLVSEVERCSPETVTKYRDRLYKKMCEVLERTDVDEQRILLEAGIFADKVAVDEETVRLRSHIQQMRELLAGGSPNGKKMDFLIQEFNRETNTIGSKCTDSAVTRLVIDLKSEIEKIREQVQNIE